MTIKVKAGRWARRWLNQAVTASGTAADTATVTVNKAIAAIEAVKLSGIPEDEIGPLELNGKIIPPGTSLQDGDEVLCHPCIMGG